MPSLNADIGPRAFRVVPSRGGTVIQHSTVPNTMPIGVRDKPRKRLPVLRTALWAAGTPQRVAAREFKESDARGTNPSHIGASNPPISEAASLSSEVIRFKAQS